MLSLQIPLNDSTGQPCDFALVDCKSPEDAEKLWKELDGSSINGGTMRVSFSSPGRLAATSFGGPQFQVNMFLSYLPQGVVSKLSRLLRNTKADFSVALVKTLNGQKSILFWGSNSDYIGGGMSSYMGQIGGGVCQAYTDSSILRKRL